MGDRLAESVYVVFGFNAHYPPPDGTIEVHDSEDNAKAVVEALEEYHNWRNKNGDTGMLPERFCDDPPSYDAYGYSERQYLQADIDRSEEGDR